MSSQEDVVKVHIPALTINIPKISQNMAIASGSTPVDTDRCINIHIHIQVKLDPVPSRYRSRSTVVCRHCKEYGHFARECPNSNKPPVPRFQGNNRQGHRNANDVGNGNSEGRKQKDNRMRQRDKTKAICHSCKGIGHYARECTNSNNTSEQQCSNDSYVQFYGNANATSNLNPEGEQMYYSGQGASWY